MKFARASLFALLTPVFASAVLGGGCSSSSEPAAKPTTTRPPLEAPRWNADCDPIVPYHCGFPFPSNTALVDDPTTVTKKRVAFKSTVLPQHKAIDTNPAPWADFDGFSPSGHIMTVLPYATTVGLPTQDDIDKSLGASSPTVLIDTSTGELVPHFSELDVAGKDPLENTFYLRPVVRLKNATRYVVGIRNVVDPDGTVIPASPAFAALRDGTASSEPSVEARRALYADIFSTLEKKGVAKKDLQIAWDFTTASRENLTSALVHMRDDALATVGDQGPAYVIDEVIDNPNEHILKRIKGRMTVPLYLEKPFYPTKLVRDEKGLPKQNGTAEFPFLVQVPKIAETKPCALLQNGHGLLGLKTEGQDGYLAKMAQKGCFVTISVDLVGMANEDLDPLTNTIIEDIGGFRSMVERQHQGILNSLLAMRMMKGRFVNDPAVQLNGHSAIDPTRAYYRGDSQGGIFGATYMALSTDVTRGVLGEPGAPYSLLLNRSLDFGPFFLFLRGVYVDSWDLQLTLGLVQMLWDRTEPAGFIPYINGEQLPNTPKHEVLLHVAIGDHQVTPLGAHYIARSVKAKNVTPYPRKIWGLEEQAAPINGGSAIVEYDFKNPEVPKDNTPPHSGEDPHDLVRALDSAQAQEAKFFQEGIIGQFCSGACDPN